MAIQLEWLIAAVVITLAFYHFKRAFNHIKNQVRPRSKQKKRSHSLRVEQSQRAFGQQHGCLPPPRIKNHRPWGLDHLEDSIRADRESRLNEKFLSYFTQLGNTIDHCFLGTLAFSTTDPANIEALLSSKIDDFDSGKRRDSMIPLLGHGIFTLDGEAWKHSRNMLRGPTQYRHYENLEIFKEGLDDLIDILSRQTGVVDLQPLFFDLTLDVSTAFLFGESVRSLKETDTSTGEGQNFTKAFNTAWEVMAWRFRLPDQAWMIQPFKFRKGCEGVHHFADRIIERNLSSQEPQKNTNVLSLLAEVTTDRNALKGQTLNLLAAGRDATACTLSWTFFLLLRHPSVLKKLREEISTHCPNPADISRSDLKKIRYVQNVMRETLRLYPSVAMNAREANKTTFLPTGGGPDGTAPVLIPKGATVAYSTYAMHRRQDLYGMDAEIFRPERWDEDLPMNRDKTTAKWGYQPFSGGPRICIGCKYLIYLDFEELYY